MTEDRKAILVLQDGTSFEGTGFGATTKVASEVVFNSTMVGYAGILTDPTYYEQILLMTYPLIGNIGVASPDARDNWNIPQFFESDFDIYAPDQKPELYEQHPNPKLIKNKGLIVFECCKKPSHWKTKMTLDEILKKEKVPGIEGIDTRELMKKFRDDGETLGILQVLNEGEEPNVEKLKSEVKNIEDPNEKNLVDQVSVKKPIVYQQNNGSLKVVLIDLGTKMNIIRSLLSRNITVIRVPHNFKAKEVLDYKPDGVVLTNGPGNPKHESLKIATETTREVVDAGIPLLGICLGNSILTLAMGADVYRMKFGHRAPSQPAMDVETNRCYASIQNHGYAVKEESLKGTKLDVWFRNVNDKTVEGVKHKTANAFAVEFHPEHQPGPLDAKFIFDKFLDVLKSQGGK